jgi:hypothetical protein
MQLMQGGRPLLMWTAKFCICRITASCRGRFDVQLVITKRDAAMQAAQQLQFPGHAEPYHVALLVGLT